MTWFRVDDRFPTSRKVLAIPRGMRAAAIGLWTLAGAWSAGEELDGAVPSYMVEELGGTDDMAAALVVAGLWTETDTGYAFVNWEEYQWTRSELEAKREAERTRKAAWRARRASERDAHGTDEPVPDVSQRDTRGTDAGVPPESRLTNTNTNTNTNKSYSPNEVSPVSKGGVGGTPPAATPRSATASKRGTRIPDPFVVTADMRAWAAREVPGLDVDRTTASFVDYWRAKTGRDATKADWVATWRNWLRRAHEDGRFARGRPTGPPSPHSARTEANLAVVAQYAEPSPEPLALEGVPS